METNENDIWALRMKITELHVKLDSVCAQNERLSEENAQLKEENNRLRIDHNISSGINVENRMQLHRIESEKEDLNANLQELQIKYDKLYDRYKAKERREKALEQFYRKPNFTNDKDELPPRTHQTSTENSSSSSSSSQEEEISRLRKELENAHDIIAGLDFELESVDFLESENERMRQELEQIKFNRRQNVVSCISVSSGESMASDVGAITPTATITTSAATADDNLNESTSSPSPSMDNRQKLTCTNDDDNDDDDVERKSDSPSLIRRGNQSHNPTEIEMGVETRVKSIAERKQLLRNRIQTIYNKN